MQIEIIRPYLLFMLPLMLFVLIAAFIIKGKPEIAGKIFKRRKKDDNTIRSTLPARKRKPAGMRSLIFHCLVASVLILAMCGLTIKWTGKEITTIFLVDMSDSASFYRENAESFLEKAIHNMPADNYAGILTFGADTELEQFITDKKVFSKLASSPNGTSTNLEDAVTQALALLNQDTAKRIVLISDGYENVGSLENTASSILANKVDFKFVKIEKEDTGEVYVNNLEIPSRISIGDTFSVNVEVMSNRSASAVLYLYSGRTLKAMENVELQKGSNQFVFKDTQEESGLKNYRAVVEAADDTETINNEYAAYTTIQAPPKVLLVEGQAGLCSEFEKVLAAANIDYAIVTPSGVPENITQMVEYRSIILADVHGDDLKAGFMDSLPAYVNDYAGGVVAIGGENSFALGNYKDTALEEVLPVYMDLQGEKQIPPLSIALVIDKSGSMSDGTGQVSNLDLAKEAAIQALDNLRDIDEIGVLCFDDGYTWTSKMQSAENRKDVEASISGINIGGGTSIYPAVEEAYKALLDSSSDIRHIILLTDGQDEFPLTHYNGLLTNMTEEKITLSTVSVGTDADTGLLENLAEMGDGRYYHTDINTNVPRIFAQEVYLSVKSYLVNREFTPARTSNHEILSAAVTGGYPSMLGYIATTAKERAQTLLVSDEDDPILSVWQYGLGKTAVFTSDVENIWTANYAGWEEYPDLWKNIIEYTVSEETDGNKSAEVVTEGAKAVITYTTDEFDSNTKVTAVYTKEDGTQDEVVLTPSSPGVYSGEIPTDEVGVYTMNVRQEDSGQVTGNINTAAVVQYSQEYRFMEDGRVLENYSQLVDGTFIEDYSEVFTGEVELVKSRTDLTFLFMILGLFIFMADIILRRLTIRLNIKDRIQGKLESYQQVRQMNKIQKQKQKAERRIDISGLKETVRDEDLQREQNQKSSSESKQQVKAKMPKKNIQHGNEITNRQIKSEESAKPAVAKRKVPNSPDNKKKLNTKQTNTKHSNTDSMLNMNELLKRKKERDGK